MTPSDVSREQLAEWAKQFGPPFIVEVEDRSFICRQLSRWEYKQIMETYESQFEQEEEICRLCILHPRDVDLDSEYAGLASSVAVEILKESGWIDQTKVASLMNKYNEEMKEFMNQVTCVISAAFPMLSIEEIECWHLEKTLWYYSRAIWKLKYINGTLEQEEKGDGLVQGDLSDFPELAAEKAFMSGKMK